MLEINRKTGQVRGSLTQEERDALWRTIIKNMGPQVLRQMEDAARQRAALEEAPA